ncbi:MAG: glycosyltransferase [Alphaproteobacteria bacterium]|nr:glycosyltransferase [Alphaproteobacteria bacterium]
MKLSILVASRSVKHILALLDALGAADLPYMFEVLISWSGASSVLSKLKVFQNRSVVIIEQKPAHYSSDTNALARTAKGEFLLLLKDGVIPDSGAVAAAMDAISSDYIGIVGANLRSHEGQLSHAGVLFNEKCEPYIRTHRGASWTDERVRNDMFVPAVSGAFLLVSREEFTEIGFDEDLDVAGEDIFFCLEYRRKFGKEILYVAGASAVQTNGATRRAGSALPPSSGLAKITSLACEQVKGERGCVMRKPGVRIITEQPGWILHRKATEVQRHLGNVKINEDWPEADIHYFINYGMMLERPPSGIVVANFTHYDPDHLGDRFVDVAKNVDHCIAVSRATADQLRALGIPKEKISVILVGADTRFEPRLTLGVVGRPYKGGRKGEDIVRNLAKDSEIAAKTRLVAANSGWDLPVWDFDDMADFYRSIDYLLVPSRLEGGPVPFMEALACGTLAIAPPVGVVPQFPHVGYPAGDHQALRDTILRLADEHLSYREHLSSRMFGLDWYGWAAEHDKVFRGLMYKIHGPGW